MREDQGSTVENFLLMMKGKSFEVVADPQAYLEGFSDDQQKEKPMSLNSVQSG